MKNQRVKLLAYVGAVSIGSALVLGRLSSFPQVAAAGGQRYQIEFGRSGALVGEEISEGLPEESEKPEEYQIHLKAASLPDGRIELTWNFWEEAAEYVLYRSNEEEGGFHRIYETEDSCRFVDKKRVSGKVYYYRIRVFPQGREEYFTSEPVRGRSLGKAALTRISNVSGSRKLVLHWKPVKGAYAYDIMRRSESEKAYQVIDTVKGGRTSYKDTGRSGGKSYFYKVCARDRNGGIGGDGRAMGQMAIDKKKKMIALTYDDGPSQYTPMVLKALKKHRAHATFFVVGSNVGRYAKSIRQASSLGCEIGNHTYAHNNLTKLSARQVESVLEKTNQAVRKQTGKSVRVMRPPGGNYNASVCRAVDMPLILWSVDTLDWKTRSTSATVQCVLNRAGDGAVVLMHDLHRAAAEGSETIIRKLKARGYQLVTVSEMAAYRGGMAAGKPYSQFK